MLIQKSTLQDIEPCPVLEMNEHNSTRTHGSEAIAI